MITESLKITEINSDCEEVDATLSSGSESSLCSENIIIESHEKRLRMRVNDLQKSILDLKEQLKNEKKMWREDLEHIKMLQSKRQRHESHTCFLHHAPSRHSFRPSSSFYSLPGDYYNSLDRVESSKMLDILNYKQKLLETENMCNTELLKVKQSIKDLQLLKTITAEWEKTRCVDSNECVKDIFVAGKLARK